MASFGRAAPPATVVMLGDSTTLCKRSAAGQKLTDYVGARLAADGLAVTVINAGKGSDTISGGLARLATDVFRHAPDLVTISFGLNDAGYLTPAEFAADLAKVVDAIRARGIGVLLITSTPFDDTRHTTWQDRFADQGGLDHYLDTQICAQMRALAAARNLPLCDLHRQFSNAFAADPKLMPQLIRGDGVHLWPAGNELAAQFVAPMIAAALQAKAD